VICVVVLQNRMDLLNGELGSYKQSCVISTLDGNKMTSIEAERVSHVREEEDHEPMTIPVIKTEPNVSCMPVMSVKHVSYRLYPELPSPISVCPCETKICVLEMDFERFLRKEIFIL